MTANVRHGDCAQFVRHIDAAYMAPRTDVQLLVAGELTQRRSEMQAKQTLCETWLGSWGQMQQPKEMLLQS